jgi:PBP1b-binding outer membrane lipoprotein LpoB
MKIKSQYFFVLITITTLILGSCSPAHSPNVTVASITATPSAQVVPTDLPPSPTAKPAPTEIQPSPTPEFRCCRKITFPIRSMLAQQVGYDQVYRRTASP